MGPHYAAPMPAPPSRPSVTGPESAGTLAPGATWLIDGYNVLHAVLLGGQDRKSRDWWGPGARRLLLERIRRFEDLGPLGEDEPTQAVVWVVFDGERPTPASTGVNPQVVFAPSADHWIVNRVRRSTAPGALWVVSADHQLAGRCRHAGAGVMSPRDFMARCPDTDD